jgi:hypothetical protein
MSADAIFLPMLATMTLTAVVWFYMYSLRIPAMRQAGVKIQTYTMPDKVAEHLSDEVNYSANNLKNLFEVPILFYALCLYLFVSGNVDTTYVVGAWLFFLFRTLHSIIHCTTNIVIRRFYCYAASTIVLWLILGRALIGEIAVYF